MGLKCVEILVVLSFIASTDGSCDNCALCQGSIMYCVACNPGYYINNGTCTQCIVNCDNCNNATSCLQCEVGFWFIFRGCHACKTGCTSCDSYVVCHVYDNEYFLENGECLLCPVNCLTCSSLTQCTSCYQGYWGNTCSETCPKNCKYNICSKFGLCFECYTGMFGNKCQYPCPENCLNTNCSSSGLCSAGCKSGFYGGSCAISCPENCKTNVCSVDGECTTGCKPGFYGSYCNQPCLNTCPNNECFQSNGSCSSMCPNTCVTCTSLSNCTSCKPGYIVTDRCNSCIPGFYGNQCTHACSDGCGEDADGVRSCRQVDGVCEFGCEVGFTGQACSETLTAEEEVSTPNTTVIGAAVGGSVVVVLIIAIVGVYTMRRGILPCHDTKEGSSDGQNPDQTLNVDNGPSEQPSSHYVDLQNRTGSDGFYSELGTNSTSAYINLSETTYKTLGDQSCETRLYNEPQSGKLPDNVDTRRGTYENTADLADIVTDRPGTEKTNYENL